MFSCCTTDLSASFVPIVSQPLPTNIDLDIVKEIEDSLINEIKTEISGDVSNNTPIVDFVKPQRKYGLIVNRIHQDKLKIKKFNTAKTQPVLPTSVDLRHKLPPCYDQGELGSCTANALCAAFQYEEPTFFGSRLFVYYNERNMEGTVSEDAGATLSDGIFTLERYGVCSETDWPYVIQNFSQTPPPNCYTDAAHHHVISATNILNNVMAMKQCLAEGYPFVVGIQIFEPFESQQVAMTGMVPMPNQSIDNCLGGHAVLVCGYNDSQQVWIVRNSWGTQWGDHGYFYLPYPYLLDSNLCSDLWYISRVQKFNAFLSQPSNDEVNASTIQPTVVEKTSEPETTQSMFSILRSYLPF